jgi:hypothetical protein
MSLVNLVIILVMVLATGVSVHFVQASWPHVHRKEHNDVGGFIFAAVGVLYAVLLAFVVVVVWENLNSRACTPRPCPA